MDRSVKRTQSRRIAFIIAFIILTFNLNGCSVQSQPNYGALGLVKVSGYVKLDGNPLSNATIEFVNESDNTFSYGYIGSDGSYSLMFDSRTEGIIPGEKSIRFRSGAPAGIGEAGLDAASMSEDPDEDQAATSTLPACYKELGKIKVNVEGSTTSMNFDLKSDCSTTTSS